MSRLIPKIGVEIHAQLDTKLKLFSNAAVDWRAVMNSQVALFDSATPGTMPRLNWECVKLALRAALIFNCTTIAPRLLFDRKHYDYWDLPAGYQITQHRQPLAKNGHVTLNSSHNRNIRIRQIHLEQDSGKTFQTSRGTVVDLNRAGVGLIELVSDPEIESPLEASQFVQKVHEALQDVGVSSGNMEEGAMRIDVNVNWICADSQAPVSPRVELKNISGIGIIGDAVQAELDRQQDLIRQNKLQHAETRVYIPQSNITLPLRSKQSTQTYRYLPEYDLPEYPIGSELIDSVKATMPLTRQARIQNLLSSKDSLNRDHLERLWSSPTNNLPDLFEACINLNCQDPRFLLNWCTNELLALLNRQDRKLEKLPFTPVAFVALVESVRTGQLDKELAKQEMSLAITQDRDVKQMTEPPLQNNNQKSNYSLIDDEIVQLFKSHPDRIKFLTSAEGRVRGSVDFFVGPLLKKFRGRVKAAELIERLKWHLYNNNK